MNLLSTGKRQKSRHCWTRWKAWRNYCTRTNGRSNARTRSLPISHVACRNSGSGSTCYTRSATGSYVTMNSRKRSVNDLCQSFSCSHQLVSFSLSVNSISSWSGNHFNERRLFTKTIFLAVTKYVVKFKIKLKTQIGIAILLRTLFPWHTSVTLVCPGVDCFLVSKITV